MKGKRLLAIAGAVTALTLGLAACGDDDEGDGDGGADGTEAASIDLTVGALIPQTGQLSTFAPAGEKAANIAVEQVETAVEEVGADHSIEMLTEDTQTEPQAATQAARRVAGEDASCIAGAWASGSTIPVAESVAVREGILQISPASTSPEITDLEDDDLVFRTAPADTFQGPLLADVVEDGIDGAEGMTVNVGARNDSYGTGLAQEFATAWEEKGGTVGQQVVYDVEQPNYNSEASQLVSGNPDALLIVDFPEPYDQVGAALVRTGQYNPEITFGPDGLFFPNLPEIVGEEVAVGMRVTAPGAPDSGPDDAFNEVFEEAGGAPRGPFDAQNFDAVMLCYLAAVAAGSTDGTEMAAALRDVTNAPGTEYTFEDLGAAIEALQNGEDINYQGVSGDVEFDDAGDPESGVFDVFQFTAEGFDPVSEVPFGDAADDATGNGAAEDGAAEDGAAEEGGSGNGGSVEE